MRHIAILQAAVRTALRLRQALSALPLLAAAVGEDWRRVLSGMLQRINPNRTVYAPLLAFDVSVVSWAVSRAIVVIFSVLLENMPAVLGECAGHFEEFLNGTPGALLKSAPTSFGELWLCCSS